MTDKNKFLVAILGEQGAKSLGKAISKNKELERLLFPRSVLAWLGVATRNDYEGEIPGVENSTLSFKKSESKQFTGTFSMKDISLTFDNANVFHLAGVVAVGLGFDPEDIVYSNNENVDRLGKNLDLLVKSRSVRKLLEKKIGHSAPDKGTTAKPAAPMPAEPPVASQDVLGQSTPGIKGTSTQPVKDKIQPPPTEEIDPVLYPKLPRPAIKKTIKVSKSELESSKCLTCNSKLFSLLSKNTVNLCFCFKDLNKSIDIIENESSYILNFGNKWDEDNLVTFWESLNGKA